MLIPHPMSYSPRQLHVPGLRLDVALAPWDAAACGFPVGQILAVTPTPNQPGPPDWRPLQDWIVLEKLGLISCRLAHSQIHESLLLQSFGFRCIEWVVQPSLLLDPQASSPDPDIELVPSTPEHLPELARIAATAFSTDRFSIDPRLPRGAAGVRYRRWVESVPGHATQRLLTVLIGKGVAGFFVIETGPDASVYWHLTALDPERQGRGWGKRTWLAVLDQHRKDGFQSVRTTISLRNTPVVNLYARLGFRFAPPSMTLHWVG